MLDVQYTVLIGRIFFGEAIVSGKIVTPKKEKEINSPTKKW